MMEYSFDVEYIRSATNLVADGLSRLPLPGVVWQDDDTVQIAHLTVPGAVSEEELRAASQVDPVLAAVRDLLSGHWPQSRRDLDPSLSGFHAVHDELSSSGPLLFRGDRLVGLPRYAAEC